MDTFEAADEMEVEQRSQELPFRVIVNANDEADNIIDMVIEARLSQETQNATQFLDDEIIDEDLILIEPENQEMEVDLTLLNVHPTNNANNVNYGNHIVVEENERPLDLTYGVIVEEHTATPEVPNNDDNPAANAENDNDLEDEDDGCPICYSPFSNMGEHRLSCLKCGHIFGLSCINHWLRVGCPSNARRCPSCNKKANLRDIRILYAKNLIALDTTERDRLQERLNQISTEKNKIEAKLNAAELKTQMQDREITTLKECITQLQSRQSVLEDMKSIANSKEGATLELFKNIEFKPSAGGRVLAFNEQFALLVASHSTANEMFPSAGIRTINAHFLSCNDYHQIHKKPIRDMRFTKRDPKILLTVSLDNTAKLYDIHNNVIVQTYTAPSSLWSCCWCENEPHKFYCGGQTGMIVSYDQRKGNKELEKISNFEYRFPVISLESIGAKAGRVLPQGGLLVCRLNNVYVYDGTCHPLPMEGPFVSMRYENSTDRILLSTRPSDKHDARHIYGQFSLSSENNSNICDVIHTINNGRCGEVMSRSNFLNSPNGEKLVCAYNAGSKKIDIFNGSSGNWLDLKDNQTMTEPILDICPFYINHTQYVPCISNTRVSLLKLIL